MGDHLANFVYFFAVVDPIGTVPVFLSVTAALGPAETRRVAVRAFVASTAILLFFVSVGEIVLAAMDIPLAAFQVAGGIILFLFALTMIFGESKPDEEIRLAEQQSDPSIFPLAVPSIASPGAILAAVLSTENARFPVWEQAQTAGVLFAVLLIAFALMLLASPIHRLLGASGASLVSRVMGLLLAAAATSNTLAGIKTYFS